MRRNTRKRTTRSLAAAALTLGLTGAAAVAANEGGGQLVGPPPGVSEACYATVDWSGGAERAEETAYYSAACTWGEYGILDNTIAWMHRVRMLPIGGSPLVAEFGAHEAWAARLVAADIRLWSWYGWRIGDMAARGVRFKPCRAGCPG